MVRALQESGYNVIASDIVNRGGTDSMEEIDFLSTEHSDFDIITNPPYKYAKEFVEHALDIVDNGRKVAMFLKLTFLESKARRELFKRYPPKRILVFSERVQCAKNGDFKAYKQGGSNAVAYAWYIWEKGYKGEPTVGWI